LSDGLRLTNKRIAEVLLSREQEVQECDATKADSSNTDGFIIKQQ
jgi:hypothetical protein